MVSFGANRNFVRAIVKAFPAPGRRSTRRRGPKREPEKITDQVVAPRVSAREKIRKGDDARRAMLRSPVRWFLVLPLGYLFLNATRGHRPSTSGVSVLALVLVLPMLWCAAFSRSRSFRIMGGGVMVAVAATMFITGIPHVQVIAAQVLSLGLLWYCGLKRHAVEAAD